MIILNETLDDKNWIVFFGLKVEMCPSVIEREGGQKTEEKEKKGRV